MTDTRRRFHAVLRPAVWDELVRYCAAHGTTFSRVTNDALATHLGVAPETRQDAPGRAIDPIDRDTLLDPHRPSRRA